MKSYFVKNLLLAGLLLVLAACGGGGSGELGAPPAAATRLVAGTVEDGPISGAQVELVDAQGLPIAACGSSGSGRCSQQFDDAAGHFSFLVREDLDLSGVEVRASGGVDQLTRVDFSRQGTAAVPLQLRAPLRLFAGSEQQVTVTPLTTLLAGLSSAPETDAQAFADLQGWLAVPAALDLVAPPRDDPEVQRLSLLVTRLALEIGGDDPFETLAGQITPTASPLIAAGSVSPDALAGLGLGSVGLNFVGLSAPAVDFAELYQQLLKLQDVAALGSCFKNHLVLTELRGLLQPADPGDPVFLANADYLGDQLLAGAGDQLVIGGGTLSHLLRFALYTYGLEDLQLWSLPSAEFSRLLDVDRDGAAVPLRSNPQLAELANLQVGVAIEVPLLTSELFTGDLLTLSQRKRDYYYNSNISHLYQAKRLVWDLHDDQINDSVMVDVVDGEAQAGRFDEALTLVRSQIYQTAEAGRGYIKLADGLVAHGLSGRANDALLAAEGLFDEVVAAKGWASFDKVDAESYRMLAKGYVTAGNPHAALAVINRLNLAVTPLLNDQLTIGNLMTAATTVADAFLDQGDQTHALEALEIMHQLAVLIPPTATKGYAYQVLALITTAQRFADVGQAAWVGTIWSEVQALRLDPLTEAQSVTYLDDMAVALYAVGYVSEAYALIDILPATPTKKDRSDALKKLATFIALRDGFGAAHPVEPADPAALTALDLINFRMIPDIFNPTMVDSQIEGLTSFSKSVGYIAQSLADAGRPAEAKEALRVAEPLVDSLDANAVKLAHNAKVNYGYVKLADLYLQLGDLAEAGRLLAKGETVLPLISNVTYHEKAAVALADLALDLGDLSRAQTLLAQVGLTFGVDGYPRVIEAFIRSGDRAGALELIAAFADAADALYDPASMDNSKIGSSEVSNLIKAARYYALLGQFDAARQTLDRALPAAWDIPVEETRMLKLAELASGYAGARAYRQGEELAWSLPFERYRNQALGAMAQTLAGRDDFPDVADATIDMDGDGQPDFFGPQATVESIAASGLQLDDDSDQDGTPDSADRWPYYAALPSQH